MRMLTRMVIKFLTVLVVIMTCNNAFALDAPVLTTTTSALDLSLSWTTVPDATGYTLHYAPKPYTGIDSIETADMGNTTMFSATLWDGASYFAAITASDGSSESGYSNIEQFELYNLNSIANMTGKWSATWTEPDGSVETGFRYIEHEGNTINIYSSFCEREDAETGITIINNSFEITIDSITFHGIINSDNQFSITGDDGSQGIYSKITDGSNFVVNVPVADIIIDGNFSDWDSVERITIELDQKTSDKGTIVEYVKLALSSDKSKMYFLTKISGSIPSSPIINYDFFFDMNRNESTHDPEDRQMGTTNHSLSVRCQDLLDPDWNSISCIGVADADFNNGFIEESIDISSLGISDEFCLSGAAKLPRHGTIDDWWGTSVNDWEIFETIKLFTLDTTTEPDVTPPSCDVSGKWTVDHYDHTGNGDWTGRIEIFNDLSVYSEQWSQNLSFDYMVRGYDGRVEGTVIGIPSNTNSYVVLNGTSFEYVELGSATMSGNWSGIINVPVSGTASYELRATGEFDSCHPSVMTGDFTIVFTNTTGDFPREFNTSGSFSGIKD